MKTILFLPLELAQLIQEDMVKEPKRQDATLILWILTQYYKDRLHPDTYKFLNERYLLPSEISKEINARKKAEAEAKRQTRKDIELRNYSDALKKAVREKNGQLEGLMRYNLKWKSGLTDEQIEAIAQEAKT